MKTAIITGASRGIGRATASLFARRGYNTVICYNSSLFEAEKLCAELNWAGYSSVTYKVDVSNSGEVAKLFCDIYNIGTYIDVINNGRGIENEKLIYNNHLKEFMKVIKYLVEKNKYKTGGKRMWIKHP